MRDLHGNVVGLAGPVSRIVSRVQRRIDQRRQVNTAPAGYLTAPTTPTDLLPTLHLTCRHGTDQITHGPRALFAVQPVSALTNNNCQERDLYGLAVSSQISNPCKIRALALLGGFQSTRGERSAPLVERDRPENTRAAVISKTMGEEAMDQNNRRKGVRKDNFTLSALRLNSKEDRLLDHRKHMLNSESAYVLRMMDVSEKLLVIRFKNLREKLSRQTSKLTEGELETLRRSEIQTPSSRPCYSRHVKTPRSVVSTSGQWCSPVASQVPRKRPKSATLVDFAQVAYQKPPKSAPASGRRNNTPAGLSASRGDNTSTSLSPSRFDNTPAGLSASRGDKTSVSLSPSRFDNTPAGLYMPGSRSNNTPIGLSMSLPVSAAVSPADLSQTTRPELVSAPAKLRATEGKTKYLSGPMVELAMEEGRERKQRFEDHRRRMLERSRVASAGLLQKKDDFLKRLDSMLHDDTDDNILEQIASGQFDEKDADGPDDEERRRERELRRKRRLRFRNIDRNVKTEILAPEEYWKNINKCRYLRQPDGSEDLSGVVTLVSEQRKLFQVWRDST
ncbi:Hypp7066 [Branchiostoma lanceolatum]|uniref:Hypp7066 protein n=1 Tax=Branchiostoma lanceolatum TaxID=7740 RepID=A0A8J9YWR5_BRALA|nr:Hypp7066 [Branchiostoma lanceolatum]